MLTLDATKAKLLDIVVLSQKNRQPDQNPGAKLTLEMDLSSDFLAHFDGALRSFLFARQAGAQGELETLQTEKLTPAASKIGTFKWGAQLTGYTLTIDYGTGGKSALKITDCVLGTWRLQAKDGGSVRVKVNAESADVDERAWSKLARLKSREITILLTPPEVAQQDIETQPPAKAPKTPKGGEASKAALDASGKNPFAQGTPEAALAGSTPH